jgi:hypothetical protein
MSRFSDIDEVTIVGYTLEGGWIVTTDYQVDDAVTNGGETYVCIQTHTASATDEPGVGANWEDYWVLIDYVESDIFGYYPFENGILHMPGTWTAADIAFLVSEDVDGPYLPLYDGATLVIIDGPVASRAYSFPAALAGSAFVKLWSNTAGVNEAQGGDRNFSIDLKS